MRFILGTCNVSSRPVCWKSLVELHLSEWWLVGHYQWIFTNIRSITHILRLHGWCVQSTEFLLAYWHIVVLAIEAINWSMLHVSSRDIGALCNPYTSTRSVARLGLKVKVTEIAGSSVSTWPRCNRFNLTCRSHRCSKPTSLYSVEIRNQLKSIVLFNKSCRFIVAGAWFILYFERFKTISWTEVCRLWIEVIGDRVLSYLINLELIGVVPWTRNCLSLF